MNANTRECSLAPWACSLQRISSPKALAGHLFAGSLFESAFRATYPQCRIAPGLVVAATDVLERIGEKDFALAWDWR